MRGKYFLDEIDGIAYSTNSFEIYNIYNKLFYGEPKKESIPIVRYPRRDIPANDRTFLKALKQERRIYECGYVAELVNVKGKYGKTRKKTMWVKNPKQASKILKKIDSYNRGAKIDKEVI